MDGSRRLRRGRGRISPSPRRRRDRACDNAAVGASVSRAGGAWRQAGVVAVAGLATGVLTQLGQGVLPYPSSQAANAISPWLLVAFLVGSTMPSMPRAAAAGIGTLALALVGYVAMILLRYGYGMSTGSLVFWGLGAVVGGPVFGAAGRAWRAGSQRQRAAALGLLVAVAVAEGIYNAVVLEHPAVGAGFVVAGLLVPLVLGRSREDRTWAYVAAIPALGLGALGYLAFTWLYGLSAGI